MPNQRIERAAEKLGLSDSENGKLEEALDVTRHLPLALIGDKVLALVIALAYHNAHFSNRQITNQIDRIANNNSLIDAGKGICLQDLLLCNGRNAPDKVPCDHLSSNLEPLKEPKVGAAIKKAPRTHFSASDFSSKVLANTVEAIIGAAFFEGGIQCAADVVRKLNIDPLDKDGNPQSGWASKWARIESTVQLLGKCPLESCSRGDIVDDSVTSPLLHRETSTKLAQDEQEHKVDRTVVSGMDPDSALSKDFRR